jgi:FkbM family methyltransferase
MSRWRRRYVDYLRSIVTLLTGISPPLVVVRMVLGLAGPGPHEIRLRGTNLRLLARDRMDIWAIKEAALDRLYERYGFPIQSGWRVMDIGAGIGEFSLVAASAGASTVAFEPFPGSCAILRENVRRNAADVRVFAQAIAGASGSIALDADPAHPVYSRSRAMDARATAGTIERPALSLADAMVASTVERIDLLKLDCEGAEYGILGGAGPDVLARVDRIVLEFHEWDGHNRAELVELLERAGFDVQAVSNRSYAGIGYLWAARHPA